jgi:protein-disulfide isomerase
MARGSKDTFEEFGSMLKRSLALFTRRAGLVLAAFALIALAPARADEFSAAQKAEIESILKSYLLKNPEILRDTAAALEEREKQAETAARQQIIADPASPLFDVSNQAVIGNPNGAITLVEFFDYNCGYCKRALADLARLMKDNPDLRVVLRDLPILAPGSVDAAKIANAATIQFKGQKFWEFHQKLLGSHGPVGKVEAIAAARDFGADVDKLTKDSEQPTVKAAVDQSTELAKNLAITGTPSYVIGDEVVVGAVGYTDLEAKILNVRKCGKVICS